MTCIIGKFVYLFVLVVAGMQVVAVGLDVNAGICTYYPHLQFHNSNTYMFTPPPTLSVGPAAKAFSNGSLPYFTTLLVLSTLAPFLGRVV